MEKKDLRIVKTKRALYEALFTLMKSKAFEEIKVSDICNEALINRSTFYAHYNDKYELLVDYINNLKASLEEALIKNGNNLNTKAYYMEMIKLLIDHIDEKKDIYYTMLVNNRNSIVLDVLLDVVTKDLKEHFPRKEDDKNGVPAYIASRFYLGAIVSIGIEWLHNNTMYTKDELFNYLNMLIPEEI